MPVSLPEPVTGSRTGAHRPEAAPLAGPVTFRMARDVPADLAAWILSRAAAGLPAFYFAAPDGTVSAGAGVAFKWTGEESPEPMAALAALSGFWSEARFETGEVRQIARAFSVFPFEPSAGQAGAWAGLPQALTLVPAEFFVTGRTVRSGIVAAPAQPSGFHASSRIAPAAGNVWGHDEWCRRAGDAVEAIRRGDLEKVVLVRQETCPLSGGFDPVALVSRLRDRYPSCYVYWFHLDGADFIGATPELLVKTDGFNVSSVALAGTAQRGSTALDDVQIGMKLQSDAKELSEHRLVVEFIRNTLADYCRRLTIPVSPELVRYRTVQHLRTRIEGRLARPVNVMNLVEALHPTPAVGGVPPAAARDWIAAAEGPSRGWYSGPIGWSAPDGSGEFAVALRGALVRDNVANLFAGCGLVGASDPENEWRETEWKLSAFRSVLSECEGARGERIAR